jgi:CheY-like chemotaxis protein
MLKNFTDDANWEAASVQVLVVADASLIRWDICDRLRDGGTIPVEASNTDEALDLLENFELQAVVVSLWVHPENVIPLAKSVRRRFPALPIISVCGRIVPRDYEVLGILSVETFEPKDLVRFALSVIRDGKTATSEG